MSNTTVIKAKSLSKNFTSYKKKPGVKGSIQSFFKRTPIVKSAVSNFELEIKKGEIIGLLGPNGAGKTTLMKMFTGIVVPSSGELEILGHNPWERNKEFRKKIALVMGQKSQLWWDIPAMDSFILLQRYYEIPDEEFNYKINYMAELLDVKKLLHIHVRRLSLGERMKLELMASLLHSPEVIFLDEPTIGLDLVAQEKIREFILDYHRENQCTILITSHYMADVQALCEKLVLILDGEKKFDGQISQFEKILGHEKNVQFNFKEPVKENLSFFTKYDPKWNADYSQVEIRIDEDILSQTTIEVLKNFNVCDFQTEKMPIERVMKQIMANPSIMNQGTR